MKFCSWCGLFFETRIFKSAQATRTPPKTCKACIKIFVYSINKSSHQQAAKSPSRFHVSSQLLLSNFFQQHPVLEIYVKRTFVFLELGKTSACTVFASETNVLLGDGNLKQNL